MTGARCAELQCTSHFSFLRGASSNDELFAQAATLGIEALAIVDNHSLAGIVGCTTLIRHLVHLSWRRLSAFRHDIDCNADRPFRLIDWNDHFRPCRIRFRSARREGIKRRGQ
jgi:hypothetical protein